MNNKQLKEALGRQCFDLTFPDLFQIWDKNEFSKTDGTYFSGWSVVRTEIKTRRFNHNTTFPGFPDGLIIQKSKYQALKEWHSTHPIDQVTYICICPDAVVIFDITHLIIDNWFNSEMPAETCGEVNKQIPVWKQVAYLPISTASHVIPAKFDFEKMEQEILKKNP